MQIFICDGLVGGMGRCPTNQPLSHLIRVVRRHELTQTYQKKKRQKQICIWRGLSPYRWIGGMAQSLDVPLINHRQKLS